MSPTWAAAAALVLAAIAAGGLGRLGVMNPVRFCTAAGADASADACSPPAPDRTRCVKDLLLLSILGQHPGRVCCACSGGICL